MNEITRQIRRHYLFDMAFMRVSIRFKDRPRAWRRKLARAESNRRPSK